VHQGHQEGGSPTHFRSHPHIFLSLFSSPNFCAKLVSCQCHPRRCRTLCLAHTQVIENIDESKPDLVAASLRDYCAQTKIDKEGRFVSVIPRSPHTHQTPTRVPATHTYHTPPSCRPAHHLQSTRVLFGFHHASALPLANIGTHAMRSR
jgi:hypothetical protein